MIGADIERFAVNVAHPLTGPLRIDGAKPGDLLAVHIEKIEPQPRGYTSFRGPDFGFLRDVFNYKYLVHWEIEGELARSPQIPGVAIPGAPFMGVMGVAPSHELMKTIVAREAELATKGHLVAPPDKRGAVPATEPLASTALRTIPPRENGGNLDVKQLVAGTTLFLPVFVEGANFSTGDAHFAQGDGESCGTAVEMAATLHARFEVLSGEAARRGQTEPSYAGTYTYDAARISGKALLCDNRFGRDDGACRAQSLACDDRLHRRRTRLHTRPGLLHLQRRRRSAAQPDRRHAELHDLSASAVRNLRIMPGYSGTPLPKKLGIKPGTRIALPGIDKDLRAELAGAIAECKSAKTKPLDFVLLFSNSQKKLPMDFAAWAKLLAPAGMLWVAWPKKTSGMKTDLNENIVRDSGLAAGLVDVKVCAISEIWSGLKFVRRLKDR